MKTGQPRLLVVKLPHMQVDEEARLAVWGTQVAIAFPSAGALPPCQGAQLPSCLPAWLLAYLHGTSRGVCMTASVQ